MYVAAGDSKNAPARGARGGIASPGRAVRYSSVHLRGMSGAGSRDPGRSLRPSRVTASSGLRRCQVYGPRPASAKSPPAAGRAGNPARLTPWVVSPGAAVSRGRCVPLGRCVPGPLCPPGAAMSSWGAVSPGSSVTPGALCPSGDGVSPGAASLPGAARAWDELPRPRGFTSGSPAFQASPVTGDTLACRLCDPRIRCGCPIHVLGLNGSLQQCR
jgi:hypothetical protein